MLSYRTAIGFTPSDHKQLHLTFDLAIQSQWTYVPRRVGKHGTYASQTHLGEIRRNQAATDIPALLAQGQIDKAYKAWCRETKKITELLYMDSGDREGGKGRGRVRIYKKYEKPKAPKAMMNTLRARRLAHLSRQLLVLEKSQITKAQLQTVRARIS